MLYLFILISLVGVVVAQLLIRKGMLLVGQFPQNISEIIPFFLHTFTNIYVVVAILSVLISSLAWVSAISRAGELSRIYPFMSLSYVLVVLLSALFLKEDVTLLRWIGVTVIGFGVFLVSRS